MPSPRYRNFNFRDMNFHCLPEHRRLAVLHTVLLPHKFEMAHSLQSLCRRETACPTVTLESTVPLLQTPRDLLELLVVVLRSSKLEFTFTRGVRDRPRPRRFDPEV